MFGIHVALLFVIEHTPFLRMFQKLKDAIQLPSFRKEENRRYLYFDTPSNFRLGKPTVQAGQTACLSWENNVHKLGKQCVQAGQTVCISRANNVYRPEGNNCRTRKTS